MDCADVDSADVAAARGEAVERKKAVRGAAACWPR